MDPGAWAAALEASAFGAWMRGSGGAYAAANLLHLLGLTLLLGCMILLDLRLLGAGRALPLPQVSRALTPVAAAGLVLQLGSGVALFAADAGPLLANRLMQVKLLMIAIGVANALLFRMLWSQRLAGWDRDPPSWGRAQAAVSLLLWLAVAAAGRLIAYL